MVRAFVFCMIGAAALSSVAEEFSAFALVDYPSLKERFRTKSSLENGLGEMLCGKDDANGLFYTYEPDGHMTVTRFRCYDYKRGLLWSKDLPKFAFNPIWCAGKYVYVGDEKDGTVRCYDLDDLRREPRVIVRPETGNVGCVEVAGYGEGRVVCFFAPLVRQGSTWRDATFAVVVDALDGRIVERIDFSNQEERDRVWSRRTDPRHYDPGLCLVKSPKDGCTFYNKGTGGVVAKVGLKEIERHLTYERDYDGNLAYDCEILTRDKAIFYNLIGHWFLFDIQGHRVVGGGRVDLDLDRECLSNAVSENCFCILVERGFWERFFSQYPYRGSRYELVEIRDGVQCRKKLPFPLEYGGLVRWDRDVCISYISLWE